MRILIWSANYSPELIGIPPLVTGAAEWFASRGHCVDVVTAVPNYPQRVVHPEFRGALYWSSLEHGVRVHRSWLRVRPNERFVDKMLYEASFALVSAPRILRRLRTTDVLVCVVPSLAAAAISTLLPSRRRVLWVQDLVSAAAATVDGTPAPAVLAAWRLERLAAQRADHAIVCSPGFSDHLVKLGVSRARIATIFNWVDTREISAPTTSANGRAPRFLYAGNLGYTQGFEVLFAAARRAKVDLEVVGEGNAADAVRAQAGDGVAVRDPVQRTEYPALLASADVHVLVQRRVAAGANLPSKIASYLASGRPVLASIDLDTPAAQLLRESGGALLVEPEQPQALADAMVRLRDDPQLREELGRRGRAFAVSRLDREVVLPQFERVLLG